LCLLTLASHKNPYFKSFVTKDTTGNRIINPTLDQEKSANLFSMTMLALDPKYNNIEFITTAMINKSDGVELWRLIIQRFKPATRGTFEKEDLKLDFVMCLFYELHLMVGSC
jgi:hypothetical protein